MRRLALSGTLLAVTAKRRLPVIRDAASAPDDVPRPDAWVGFGIALLFGAWLPLAYLGELVRRWILGRVIGGALSGDPADFRAAWAALSDGARFGVGAVTFLLHACPLAAASFAAGYVVGRWGKPAGRREAVLAAAGAVALVTLLAAWGTAEWTLVAAGLGAGALSSISAFWGAVRGARR